MPLLSFISVLIILLSLQVLCKKPVLTHLATKGSYPCCLFQSGFLWCRKWVIFRCSLNVRRARTDSCSASPIILSSGKVATLGHLRASFSSDSQSCQWVTFTRASFQAVTSHSLSLQTAVLNPQWHICIQVVCRGLASDINKLFSSFKCLREPVGFLQAHYLVYSLGWGFIPRHSRAQQRWSGELAALSLFCSAPEATTVRHWNFKEPGPPAGSDANFFEAAELLQFKIPCGKRGTRILFPILKFLLPWQTTSAKVS